MMCWALWTNRNNLVWRNNRWSPRHLLDTASRSMIQRQKTLLPQGTLNIERHAAHATRWEKPRPGWLKINVDAAVFWDRGLTGIGWVVRDSSGASIAARSNPLQMQLRPHEAEAMGAREALSWIKSSVHSPLVLEMDAQGVLQDLTNSGLSFSPYAMLVADCQALPLAHQEIVFSFVHRYGN